MLTVGFYIATLFVKQVAESLQDDSSHTGDSESSMSESQHSGTSELDDADLATPTSHGPDSSPQQTSHTMDPPLTLPVDNGIIGVSSSFPSDNPKMNGDRGSDVWKWEDLEGDESFFEDCLPGAGLWNDEDFLILQKGRNVFVPRKGSCSRLNRFHTEDTRAAVMRPGTSVHEMIHAVQLREQNSLLGSYDNALLVAESTPVSHSRGASAAPAFSTLSLGSASTRISGTSETAGCCMRGLAIPSWPSLSHLLRALNLWLFMVNVYYVFMSLY